MKVGFVTFGCRLNLAEALDLEARYAAAGWEIAQPGIHDSALPPPDLIIVRGCSVTAKAQRDCEKAIAGLKRRYPSARLVVTGCHPSAASPESVPWESVPADPSPIPTRLSRAYLKVQDGCSGKCAFCIVPSFRGTPVSMQFAKILERAKAYIAAGFRELVVTGCNLCLYSDSGRDLADLVSALASLDSPGHRVRLGSIEPGMCDSALVDAMCAHKNVCRFLHLSLQSASDRVLRAMKRPYSIGAVASFCDNAADRRGPRLAFGADLITGFPGEAKEDHAATRDFVASAGTAGIRRFMHLHVFPFSERKGTAAADMKPVVPAALRRARAKELEALGAANREMFARSLAGQEVTVCVERDGNGRTDEYLRCMLAGAAERRSLVRATVTDYFPKTGSLSATIRA